MKPPHTSVVLGLTATALLALSSCSGSNDTATDSTTPAVATVPDTGPTTSFNVPQVTAATVPTTDPNDTTTIAPTTSQPPVAGSVEEAVAAAVVTSRDAYLYAIYNVDAPDWREQLEATTSGASLALSVENVETLQTNGWKARPNPDIPSVAVAEGEFELIDDTTAAITICTIAAGVVYAPAATGGAETIINNEIDSVRSRSIFKLVDGVWKLDSGDEIESWKGLGECPAA
jgi:hypothetical protein